MLTTQHGHQLFQPLSVIRSYSKIAAFSCQKATKNYVGTGRQADAVTGSIYAVPGRKVLSSRKLSHAKSTGIDFGQCNFGAAVLCYHQHRSNNQFKRDRQSKTKEAA
jgi:hypothetical protein